MTDLASIVIPISNYHEAIAHKAIASAHNQTIPCEVIPVYDKSGKGAGAARNAGANIAQGLFLVFLDADDELMPDFVEQTVKYYKQGEYVYTDWLAGEERRNAPDICAWHSGTWHPVTTLLPTAIFRAMGGFDETLPAVEDAKLYLSLQQKGICGIRCPEPLLNYTAEGQRSVSFRSHRDYDRIRQQLAKEYLLMGCGCGQNGSGVIPDIAVGDGDILATAQNEARYMSVIGPVSGRSYARPKAALGYRLSVDPRDVSARPNWWQPVNSMVDKTLSPAVADVLRMAQEALG